MAAVAFSCTIHSVDELRPASLPGSLSCQPAQLNCRLVTFKFPLGLAPRGDRHWTATIKKPEYLSSCTCSTAVLHKPLGGRLRARGGPAARQLLADSVYWRLALSVNLVMVGQHRATLVAAAALDSKRRPIFTGSFRVRSRQ